jgi:hypothetical protein
MKDERHVPYAQDVPDGWQDRSDRQLETDLYCEKGLSGVTKGSERMPNSMLRLVEQA